MERMLSVTEVRSQLPTLVKEVVEQDSPVIISTWNQPKAAIIGYKTFIYLQKQITLGAKYQLHLLVNKAQSLLEETQEGSVSGDGGLYLFWCSFGALMREAWEIGDTFSKPHAMLAFQLFELAESCLAGHEMLEIKQLQPVAQVLRKLDQDRLMLEDVAEADRYLLRNKIDASFPLNIAEDLNALYDAEHEDEKRDYWPDEVEA